MWIVGLVLSGFGTILGGVNFITTIFCMRAPGMTMFRMPMFCWNALLTSILVLLAFPVLAAALLVLEIDQRLGAHVFDAASGGAILWQNLEEDPWGFGSSLEWATSCPPSELQRMLAERGMVISAGKMSGLWSGNPNVVKLQDLDVICAVLGCGVEELLIAEPGAVAAPQPAAEGKATADGTARPAVVPRGQSGRTLPPR